MLDVVVKFGNSTERIRERVVYVECDDESQTETIPVSDKEFRVGVQPDAVVSLYVTDVSVDGKLSPDRMLLDKFVVTENCLFRDPVAYVADVAKSNGKPNMQFGEDPKTEVEVVEVAPPAGTEVTTPDGQDGIMGEDGDGLPVTNEGEAVPLTEEQFGERSFDTLPIDPSQVEALELHPLATIADVEKLDAEAKGGLTVVHGIGPKGRKEIMAAIAAERERLVGPAEAV